MGPVQGHARLKVGFFHVNERALELGSVNEPMDGMQYQNRAHNANSAMAQRISKKSARPKNC